MLKRIFHGTAIGVIAALLSGLLWQTGRLDNWEAPTWDMRARFFKRSSPSTDHIRLIFLDQASLNEGKKRGWSWPWPRQVYAPVLDFCRRGGAKAVAFDVMFTEPSLLGVDDDLALGGAIAAASNFVGAVFVSAESEGSTRWPPEVPRPGLSVTALTPASTAMFKLPQALFPVPELATNAAMLATVFGNPDADGIYRRVRPFNQFDGEIVPSFGLAAFLTASPVRSLKLGPGVLELGDRSIPLDANGLAILRYRGGSQTHKTVNIMAVIESEMRLREGRPPLVDPALFKDAYVFLGFTAPALLDLKPTPVAAVYPGVEVHATFLDNLLAGDFMREAARVPTMLLTLFLAIGSAVAVRLGRAAWQNVLAFAVFLTVPVFLGFSAYNRGIWLPIVVQMIAVAPALTAALAVNYATEGRQKRFIKGAFKQYLSPLVIEELVRHPDRLKLGGELRELSILFSDVQAFTAIAEKLGPEQLTDLLNEYLTAMTDVIYANGGTVDKYEGDAIIAFWNAPLAQPDHALRAVRAALQCQARLAELRAGLRAKAGTELHARIGINSGPVVVGNMGSRQRFNYTFLGDAGNLASRLEGINKQLGTAILISESTHRQLSGQIPTREISRVRVVGRREPVAVYEPLSETDRQGKSDVHTTFARGLAAYYAGRFEEALDAFASAAELDPVAAVYARRCRDLVQRRPEQWDGVWVMTEK